MELGAEISQKVKKTIKKQLKTLGCYVDDELPEYIMVMIANKRTEEQMVEDLQLFLNDEAEKFVSWMIVVLSRIKKAMELPDIDAIVGDVEMGLDCQQKLQKTKKDNKNSSSEVETSKGDKRNHHKSDNKRRSRDGSRRESEEKDREKRHHNQTRGDRHKSREEDDKREKERKQRPDDRSRRDKGREEEAKKRRNEREEEISKRRAAREKRYQEDKQRKDKKDHDPSDEKDRKHSRHSEDHEEHKRSRDDSKRTEGRPNRNPMEFVKQIARDITDQLTVNDPTTNDKNNDENQNNSDNAEHTQNENVLLQAVSQYNDVDVDAEKVDNDSHNNKSCPENSEVELRSHSQSESEKQRDDKSRRSKKSKSPSAGRHHEHSKDKSSDRSRKDMRESSSRRDSDEARHRNGSSGRRDSNSRNNNRSESKRKGRSRSPKRKHSSSHNDRNNKEQDAKADLTDGTEEDNEQSKPSLSSQVQVFTDFKRKPSLSKHNQATNNLLKRAVTEVVNEKPDGEENEDDVELDYNETNDENEFSDDDRNNEVIERRVINFDAEKSGLPTITVNFNQSTSSHGDGRKISKSDERDHYRNGNNDHHSRNKHHHTNNDANVDHRFQGISKYDARYTILRSRAEPNNDRRVRHHKGKHEKSSNHEKSLSSMVADLEEKPKRHSEHDNWKDKRSGRDSDDRHRDSSSNRKHHSSHSMANEEVKHHLRSVKDRRIEMHDTGGDLRNLLSCKKVERKSSSDEDSSTRRIREKIKAEKHKILFGKLKSDERDRSKREREHLVEKLKCKTRKRKVTQTETNESPEWIEKITDYVKNASDLDDDVEEEKTKEEDEWEVLNEAFEPYEDDDSSNPVTEAPDEDGENDNSNSNSPSEGNAPSTGSNTPDGSNKSNDANNSKNITQNDLEEVSDEELNDESEPDGEIKRQDGEYDDDNIDFETSRGSNENSELEKQKDENGTGEEMEEDVVEIEVEVSDNENLDNEVQGNVPHSRNNVRNGSTKEKAEIVDLIEDDKNVSQAVIKDSMHAESSEDSAFHDENHDVKELPASSRNSDKYERKSKSKSYKRKRMRHEFIVTLEGLGEGKKVSIETAGREKSPKVRRIPERRSERHRDRRHRHMRRSQSDEEFEEILRRKEAEEKRFDHSKSYEGKRSHRSRSHSSEKESKHRESRVNREIMLAESKLKTQKVFKKCLETVKNVTNNFAVGTALTALDGNHTAAFINPHFAHKLPIQALNPVMIPRYDASIKVLTPVTTYPSKPICTLAVGEKIILQSTLTPNRDSIAVKPLRIERSKDYVVPTALDKTFTHIDTSNLNKDNISNSAQAENQQKEVEKEHNVSEEVNINTETPFTVIDTFEDGNITSLTSEMSVNEEAQNTNPAIAPAPTKASIQERCAFWPNCKNQPCPYIHPSVNCKLFPNCSYGQHCIYIHPPCMFGESCSNTSCPFMHVQTNPLPFTGYTQICKFYPNCVKSDCPFKHVAKPCRYGASCNNIECSFSHDDVHPSLPSSALKWVAEKPHVSERKFAAVEAIVTHMPVTIVTSTT